MKQVRHVWLIAISLLVVAQAFAVDQIFMGFDETSQKMQAVVRSDSPFRAVITYDQSNPGGFIGDVEQVPVNEVELWGQAPLSPTDGNRVTEVPNGTRNIITATATLYNENDEYLGTLTATDTLFADVDQNIGVYRYQRDGEVVLPDSIRVSSAFCAHIVHGTYIVPIVCDYPSIHGDYPDPSDVEVYVANGCQTGTECNEVCNPIDWNLFTWNIRSRPGCIVSLIMTYCDGTGGCICIWRSDDDLPVELTGFDAIAGDSRVAISWNTASESDLSRFHITRSTNPGDAASWELVGRVAARNSASGSHYTWTDERVANGVTYYYKLHVIDANEHSSVYNVDGNSVVASATPRGAGNVPLEFRVDQNYPNPFNSQTAFSFAIPSASHVTLKVYDIMGREVATVVDSDLQPNSYTVNWSAQDLATGVYMYTLTAGNVSETRKLLFLK